jgi:hypothetical protein
MKTDLDSNQSLVAPSASRYAASGCKPKHIWSRTALGADKQCFNYIVVTRPHTSLCG